MMQFIQQLENAVVGKRSSELTTPKPMLVVFDTCTRAEYRRDVHRVLALPHGAVLRYNYKRYLYSSEAAELLSAPDIRTKVPVDAILMYGELQTYKFGDDDTNLPMLTWDAAKFVSTRSAQIVNVTIQPGATSEEDVIDFHLKMRGYIDPSTFSLKPMVKALEARNQLPFGDRETQHCWISLLPTEPNIDRHELISNDKSTWTRVVRWMFEQQSQFKDDIFWRVEEVRENLGESSRSLVPHDRKSNQFGDISWARDYPVHDQANYEIRLLSYDPNAHGFTIPGNATLALLPQDDSESLILAPANPVHIRQNALWSTRFSVASIETRKARFASIELETQIPDWSKRSDPGSRCTLTVRVSKPIKNMLLAGCFGLLTAVFGGVGVAYGSSHVGIAGGCTALVGIFGWLAWYAWRGRIK
jgi:hypothetical protein